MFRGISVYILSIKLGVTNTSEHGDVIGVTKIIRHPGYMTRRKPYDAAILVLERTPDFEKFEIKVSNVIFYINFTVAITHLIVFDTITLLQSNIQLILNFH